MGASMFLLCSLFFFLERTKEEKSTKGLGPREIGEVAWGRDTRL